MRERTIFECEHCKKYRKLNKNKVKEHEANCWYNPENRTCVTCKFGDIDDDHRSCYHPERVSKPKFEGINPRTNCLFWEEKEE